MKTSDKIDTLLLCGTSPTDRKFLLRMKDAQVLMSNQVVMIDELWHRYRAQHRRCVCKFCKEQGARV